MTERVQYASTVEGALDPREHDQLVGHEAQQQQLRGAFAQDRFPQAWLLQGPMGIGKATFAWHFARRLVETGAIDDQPLPAQTVERYARGAQTEIFDVTYPADDKGGFKSQITVDALRSLNEKLIMSAADGAWRVVIIDPAEAMNANAANAVLKLLEEPPARVVFFLVSHAPHRLLPTIHSRCQKLRFQELSIPNMQSIWPLVTDAPAPDALRFELAEGSIRLALTMGEDMTAIYDQMVGMIGPNISRDAMLRNARAINKGGRAEAIDRAKLLFQLLFARLARVASELAAGQESEARAAALIRPALQNWAVLSVEIQQMLDDAQRLNLDVEVTILEAWFNIDKALKPA